MGVTSIDIQNLENLIRYYQPRKVVDLGAQNNYAQPKLPAPYMREWWEAKGIEYASIDLSNENGCIVLDLSVDNDFENEYDFVMDYGTSEHVGTDGKFSWEAIYNCWQNKHRLLNVGGLMISENPKTGNWPGHGFNYYTQEFYHELKKIAGYMTIEGGEIPAMNNTTDGWNVYCTLRKFGHKFPSLEEFKTLDLRTS